MLVFMPLDSIAAAHAKSATTMAPKVKSKPKSYYFYKYQLDFGYYNRDISDLYVHKYVTWPYIPIFWKGAGKVKRGFLFSFQYNFFHTSRWFSLDVGTSAGHWVSAKLSQDINTVSIYLALKVWLIRSDYFDFYFTYSAAGPTYISRSEYDNHDMYSRFTFQDFIGFGAFIGKDQALNVSFRLVHYSNGFLVPKDPGMDVPFLLTIGWAW